MSIILTPLPDNPMAAAAHAFKNDRFAPFVDINSASQSSQQRTCGSTGQRFSAFGSPSSGPQASPEDRCAKRFVIKLVAGQRLAGRKVGLVCCRRNAV